MNSAVTGPWSTSATRTATVPATVAPIMRDERAEEDQHADGEHERHPEDRRPSMMPTASTAATITVARTNMGQRPPGDPARAVDLAREPPAAASRTTQDQIRAPSARKKYVENRTMKKPAKTWLDRRTDLAELLDDLAVLGCSR